MKYSVKPAEQTTSNPPGTAGQVRVQLDGD